jgi:hypothetical protein
MARLLLAPEGLRWLARKVFARQTKVSQITVAEAGKIALLGCLLPPRENQIAHTSYKSADCQRMRSQRFSQASDGISGLTLLCHERPRQACCRSTLPTDVISINYAAGI